MRILLVEDDVRIGAAIKKGLEQEAMAVDWCTEGDEAFDLAVAEHYDVIVLDWMLPGKDGLSICTELRKEAISVPILMLTAKGELENRVDGLNSGADDYLVKPFEFDELLARIRALSRRPKQQLSDILVVGDLALDRIQLTVHRGKIPIKLSKREFSLLEYLLRNRNQLVTKDQIIQHVWDYDADILPNTVEVYIGYLRTKIDKAFPERLTLIHTVRGFGYKLAADTT